MGGLSVVACFADLATVIAALLAARILIQFVGQIVTVFYVRAHPALSSKLRFRMAFYPLPALIALAGWLYVFGASDRRTILYGLGSLLLGLFVFECRDRAQGPRKPIEAADPLT